MDGKKIVVGGVIALLAVLLVLSFVSYNSKVADIKTLENNLVKANTANENNQKAIDDLMKQVGGLSKQITTINSEKAELEKKLAEALLEPEVPEVPDVPVGIPIEVFKVDELKIGQSVSSIMLSDTKLSKLFDGKVSFDGESYDAEEIVTFAGLTIANDDEEYKGEAFLTIDEDSVFYKVVFDNELDLSKIGLDENYLVINFLGKPLEITEWDGNEITIQRGVEYNLREGDKVTIDGKELEVTFISDNDKASFKYNGEVGVVSEGNSRDIGGLDIYVDTVLYNARAGFVTIRVGLDVKETYVSGDEFVEDSIFVWYIDEASRTLGVVLEQGFEGNDAEEDYNALAYGEKLLLPNDYLTMKFDGLSTEDMINFKMDLGTKNSVEYVRIEGKFEYGTENYNRLYVKKLTSDVYGLDENNDLVLLGNVVQIEDADFSLVALPSSIKIQNDGLTTTYLEFNKDFSAAYQDGNLLTGDEAFINSVGMRVKSIDDSLDDEKYEFSVPEEAITATVSFTLG